MDTIWEEKNLEMTALLKGEIDHHTAGKIREKIDAAVIKHQVRRLNLDFSGVSFMDSSGIGLIMGRFRLMQSRGGELRVVKVPPRLKKLMLMAGLSQLRVICEEKEGEDHAKKKTDQ